MIKEIYDNLWEIYPNKSMIGQHMEALSESMDLDSSSYESFSF